MDESGLHLSDERVVIARRTGLGRLKNMSAAVMMAVGSLLAQVSSAQTPSTAVPNLTNLANKELLKCVEKTLKEKHVAGGMIILDGLYLYFELLGDRLILSVPKGTQMTKKLLEEVLIAISKDACIQKPSDELKDPFHPNKEKKIFVPPVKPKRNPLQKFVPPGPNDVSAALV